MTRLTRIVGVPDSSTVVRGMAHFAGTGPDGKTCGDCYFRGYYRQRLQPVWDAGLQREVVKTYRHSGCEKFKRLTGHHGPTVNTENRSCKYFEHKIGD
jgi:hypothetical protein